MTETDSGITETDSGITRGYRGYNEKVIGDINRGYNAGTRDYDSIREGIGG